MAVNCLWRVCGHSWKYMKEINLAIKTILGGSGCANPQHDPLEQDTKLCHGKSVIGSKDWPSYGSRYLKENI